MSTDDEASTNPGAAGFELLPAIDLRAGNAVRLMFGDFDRETIYEADPVSVAERFAEAGSRWLHVVDLDGARSGATRQLDLVGAIVQRVGERLAVQVAGGLRDEAAVSAVLALGVRRVVVGTAAIADPAFAAALVARHGSARIVVALDVRAGRAVGEGWREGAQGRPVETAMAALLDGGVETFAVTAIERDGSLLGPDLALLRRLLALGRGRIIASGGIRSTQDLLAIRRAGATGAIVGKAIYEGRIDLRAAVEALA